jgi:hypothetical protein
MAFFSCLPLGVGQEQGGPWKDIFYGYTWHLGRHKTNFKWSEFIY